jgi:DNA repair protein RecO (recombination protein O)
MEWSDEGIVVGVRRHGETSVILEAMTRDHGRHLGLVRGGRSSRMQPVLQPGNRLALTWQARIDEHLGLYKVELVASHAARLMETAQALYGLAIVTSLARLLSEREAHGAIYETLQLVIDHLDEPGMAPALIVRFELAMLGELGFGLDLAACAVTGARENLSHVSPKSGRAVSAPAAAPFADRLLSLPRFLWEGQGLGAPAPSDIAAGFALTGYFLQRHVYEPRGLQAPPEREKLMALLRAASENQPAPDAQET